MTFRAMSLLTSDYCGVCGMACKVMAAEGLKVGAHTIPKGDVVGLCAPASNLDHRYWHDALAFKPERFDVSVKEISLF